MYPLPWKFNERNRIFDKNEPIRKRTLAYDMEYIVNRINADRELLCKKEQKPFILFEHITPHVLRHG